MEIDLENSEIHEEFSYLHHPELLNLPPFEAVFRAVGGVMPRKFGGFQDIVDAGNSLNQDLELGRPVMTKKGILENKKPECRALLDYVKMEIESLLENLEYIDGVKFPLENRNIPGYRKLLGVSSKWLWFHTFKSYSKVKRVELIWQPYEILMSVQR